MGSSACDINVKRAIYTEEDFAKSFQDNETDVQTYRRPLHKRVQDALVKKVNRIKCSAKDTVMKLFPILEWLPSYNFKRDLLVDFTGGVTVGVMHIPQGLAFAMLASLPPVTGLYTALIPVLIYMLMGTSKYISQGSFAVICLMVAQVCQREVQTMNITPSQLPPTIGPPNGTSTLPPHPIGPWSLLDSKKLEVAVSLALLIGFMQVVMGLAKLGFVATYLSDPLISGFTTGSAVLVVLSQLKHILGQTVPQFTGVFTSVKIFVSMLRHIATSNLGAIITGVVCLLILIALKYLNERYKARMPFPIPAELLVVVIGTAISYGAAINANFGVKVLGTIPKGLPPISIPSFQLMRNIIPDAFVISVVIFATNISLANMFAKKHGHRIDANQELIAYGVCNIGASFFSSFPICNALARTAVQENLAHTQLCSVPVMILMLLVLLFLSPLFFHLPKAILAAVVIANLTGLLRQFSRLKQLWGICRMDAVVWFASCFGVILLGVDLGLGLGILVAVFVVIIQSSRPRHSILGHIDSTELYRDIREYTQAKEIPGIKILRFESSLYFANAEYLKGLLSYTTIDLSNPTIGLSDATIASAARTCDSTADANLEVVIATELNGNANNEYEETEAIQMSNHCPDMPCDDSADISAVIVDASAFTFVDSVGIAALNTIISEYKARGVHICLASCSYHLRQQLMTGGILNGLHANHMFVSIHDAVSYILQPRKLKLLPSQTV